MVECTVMKLIQTNYVHFQYLDTYCLIASAFRVSTKNFINAATSLSFILYCAAIDKQPAMSSILLYFETPAKYSSSLFASDICKIQRFTYIYSSYNICLLNKIIEYLLEFCVGPYVCVCVFKFVFLHNKTKRNRSRNNLPLTHFI